MSATPDDVRSWSELAGAFLAGLFGLRGAQFFTNRKNQGSTGGDIEALAAAIRADGAETRKILSAMRTDLAILLDRERRHLE
jgi:hypothetical protein